MYFIVMFIPQALMLFLQKVSAHSSKSLMDSNNLALVMVPNLMSLPDQGGRKRSPTPPNMDKLTGLVSYCSLIFPCGCLMDSFSLFSSHCYFVSVCEIDSLVFAHSADHEWQPKLQYTVNKLFYLIRVLSICFCTGTFFCTIRSILAWSLLEGKGTLCFFLHCAEY